MNEDLARIGLGGAALGVLYRNIDDEAARASIDAAWDAGIRKFDTSPLYGGGVSERRFGEALAARPRDAYFLATKTGVARPYGQGATPPGGTRRSADIWDYSPKGTQASIAASLERLRVERLDLVHLHDIEGRLDSAMEAYPALAAMREKGIVGGIGIGANTVEAPLALMARARFDAILVAGRYTLLDQSMLALFAPARAAGTKLFAGGAFNSGVLATGLRAEARYGYEPVTPEIARRVNAIEAICARHGVPMRAAAIRFPLLHPEIDTLVLGAGTAAEVADSLAMLATPIQPALWRELVRAGLLDEACPVP
jgi:D-threo-aldose 1-dehydrogenase